MMILAISAVALSVSVMLITISTVRGFQNGIRQKVVQLHGDLIVDNAANMENAEPLPFEFNKTKQILTVLGKSKHANRWALSCSKAAIIKGEEDLDGVVATGMDLSQTMDILNPFMTRTHGLKETQSNHPLEKPQENWIYISTQLSKRLKLDTGDLLTLVFFKHIDSINSVKPKPRRLRVMGLFETGIDQIDQQIVYIPKEIVAEFLSEPNSLTKLEIWAKAGESETLFEELKFLIPGGELRLNTSRYFHRQIYDWLSILNTNVWIILIMMAIVCFIAVTTILLILIFERIRFIGLVQVLGAELIGVQRVFLWQVIVIISLGLLVGDVLAFGLCWLQEHFQWIKLNQSIYFVSHVMVDFSFTAVLLVNLGLLILSSAIALIPLQWIKRMALSRAIQY